MDDRHANRRGLAQCLREGGEIMYKFEKLEVWSLSIEYLDLAYSIFESLPKDEDINLKSQMRRAATSVALNIAEGSTDQTDAEQSRFIGHAIRSLVEVVACLRIVSRRGHVIDDDLVNKAEEVGLTLTRKLQAIRNAVDPTRKWIRGAGVGYALEEDNAKAG
jgi:four helix bundle protein